VVLPAAGEVGCITHAFSGSTPKEGVEAALVHVPVSQSDLHSGLEGSSRSTVSAGGGEDLHQPGVASPPVVWAGQQAEPWPRFNISGEEVLHEMIVTSVWGTPTTDSAARIPRMPCVSVKKSDGDRLLKLLESGPVKVRLMARAETKWRKIPLTVAEIPGSEEPERFMLVHGHMDSWYVGTTDNCTGTRPFSSWPGCSRCTGRN